MKKIVIVTLIILIIAIVGISYTYMSYTAKEKQIKQINETYETCYKNRILGTDFATIINKTIDLNEKNKIEKDENGKYIDNGKNSIIIEIKFKDSDDIFRIEQIHRGKIENFINNYSTYPFECMKIEHHAKTNMVSYLYFEEV